MTITADQIASVRLRVGDQVEALIDLLPHVLTPSVGAVIEDEQYRYCVRLVVRTRAPEARRGASVVGVMLD